MRRADQRPFALHLLESSQQKLSEAARVFDLANHRLDEAGNAWVIEANPNPQIARGEDFAASAEKVGISYEGIIQRITNLGLRWQPESLA